VLILAHGASAGDLVAGTRPEKEEEPIMNSYQKQYLLSKLTDYWYMIDRTRDPEVVQRYLGKIDGVYTTVELFGYRIVRDRKTGDRKIITESQYEKQYA
jgi:hypothetical protein